MNLKLIIEIKGIVRMIEATKEGDLNAAKLILSYAIEPTHNPTNPNRVELNDPSIQNDIVILITVAIGPIKIGRRSRRREFLRFWRRCI